MEFLISDEIDIPPCTHDDFMSLKLRLYSWRKSYNKQVDEQRWCHYEDDMEALITPEQVSTFESGELARTAIKLFGKVSVEDNFNPSMLEYTNMRDYLITTIALANAPRFGVSANMVIGEYEKHQSSGENVIIRVRNHKTFRKHGFAHVCIPSHTFQLLKLFVEKVRSCIQASCDNIFVTWKGKPLNSGAVSKEINSTWKRSGVYGDKPPPKKNICANVIRRSVTSLVHDQQLEKALPVADLLAHSLTTAGKHYRRREMEKQASVGSKVIHDVLHFKKRELSSESSTLRRAWSEDELSTMKELFKDSLEAGDILLETVREKASSLNFKGRTEKQVYDKLRSIIRY